jgi:hypothetical protein
MNPTAPGTQPGSTLQVGSGDDASAMGTGCPADAQNRPDSSRRSGTHGN